MKMLTGRWITVSRIPESLGLVLLSLLSYRSNGVFARFANALEQRYGEEHSVLHSNYLCLIPFFLFIVLPSN